MRWVGANFAPKVTAVEELPGQANYFLGDEPSQWRTKVPTYAKVKYQELYPGVDLIYYGSPRHLEYDFVIAPGADPKRIRMEVQGADRLAMDSQGDLVLHSSGEEIRWRKPLIYQQSGGRRQEIAGGYVLEGGHQFGFEVGSFDGSKPLVIDPVLIYSTYLGGSGSDNIESIKVDASGNVYVTGITDSPNFPTATPLQSARGGGEDAFVAKLNPAGSALVYSTYLGGSGTDEGFGIAVDASGSVYIVGDSDSTNFPTVNPLQAANGGDFDVIVARLNASGSALTYSTYLGGDGGDSGFDIAVDSTGNALVVGTTASNNFPRSNPLQANRAGESDAFVAKLNPVGSTLAFSTYLGGSTDDLGLAVALDSSGNAYVTGLTLSANFPTLNPLQGIFGGGTCGTAPDTFPCPDVFVTKLNPSGSSPIYSTFLGGNNDDEGLDIAVDSSENAYVIGATLSMNFPTAGPFQAGNAGPPDAFVSKLNPSGSALLYSTYLGGVVTDIGIAIAVDSAGSAYVAGATNSSTFPIVNSLQARSGFDAFVTKFNPAGSALVYSTYLGGSGTDQGITITVDSAGNAYVAGGSNSNNFPRVNPLQSSFGGGTCGTSPCPDAFLAKLAFRPAINPGGTVNGASYAAGAAVTPGSIVAAFGTDLTSFVQLAGAVPLPTTLGDVTVTMNNAPVPLFFVSGGQINLQIPWELSGQAQASLTVVSGGTTIGPATVRLTSFAPGIFSTNSQGSGQGAVLIASTGEVAAPVGSIPGRVARPANRGEFVTIYCTGLGDVTSRPASGAAAPASPLSTTTATPSVTIGGLPATVNFSGLAPTFVGLYQINAQVPTDSPTGSIVPVVVSIGGATSNLVLMAVQ